MKKKLVFILVILLLTSCSHKWGKYEGSVVTKWDRGGRKMTLLEDFKYIAPDSVEWIAPKGSVVDGASIPKFAWSFIGGPYEGKYRNASVIHDVACAKKDRPWKKVHRAFYTAMRASKVKKTKALVMYCAVYHFGPRWGLKKTKHNTSLDKSTMPGARPMSNMNLDRETAQNPEESFNKMKEKIINNNLSLEEIEALEISN